MEASARMRWACAYLATALAWEDVVVVVVIVHGAIHVVV